LTAASSSRWAGAITRTSEDAWQLASRNLAAERATLNARVRKIEARTAVSAGKKRDRLAGYATPAERHGKTLRLKALKARLARAERRTEAGAVSVARGGRRLMRARLNLAAAGLTEEQWRAEWESARLFLTADGEKDKAWGNETIRVNHDEGWLELKLPAPLAHLANRPRGRYRLSCEARFEHRGDEVAAQAATGAVRYDICHDPVRGRWYIDASWKIPARPAPSLEALCGAPVIAVDVNAGHLAVAVVAPDGNVTGTPFTIPLQLAGLPAATRDGHVRAAVTQLITTAREHGARAVVIENLDFTEARAEGRDRTGNRPARGRPGRGFRRLIAGIPTARFRTASCKWPPTPVFRSWSSTRHIPAAGQPSTGSVPCASATQRLPGTTLRRWCSADADSATGPGAARTGTAPPQRTQCGQPGRDPGNPRLPRPHQGSPAPHETPGSHPAVRPERLTGQRRATRRARTVRGRPPGNTHYCAVTRNG
jgi:hypothetical protein